MASESIGRIFLELGADASSLKKDISKALGSAEKTLKGFGSKLKRSGAALTKGLTLPIAGVATAFAGMASAGLKSIDSLAKTADKLGVTTEALSGLRHAAQLSGVSVQTFDMALQRMVRRVAEAAQGTGEAKDAIAELGLDAGQLAALAPDKQMAALADAMANVSNQGDRVRLAMKLFDSEGVSLVNTLAMGSKGLNEAQKEAERLGIAFSRVDAAKVEAANDAMTNLGAVLSGVGQSLAVQFAPLIERAAVAVERFATEGLAKVRAFAQANPELLKLGAIFTAVAAAVGPLVAGLGFVVSGLGAIAGAIGAIGAGPILAVVAGIAALGAGFVAFKDEIIGSAQQIVSSVTGFWEQWSASNADLLADLSEAWGTLKVALGELWTALQAAGAQLVELFGDRFREILGPIGGAEGAIDLLVQTVVVGLTKAVEVISGFVGLVSDAMPTIVTVIETTSTAAGKFVEFLIDGFNRLKGVVIAARDAIVGAWRSIEGATTAAAAKLSGAIDSVVGTFERVTSAGRRMWQDAFGGSWARDFFDGMFAGAARFEGDFQGPITESFERVSRSGKQLLDGLGRDLSRVFQTGRFEADAFLNTISAHFADLAVEQIKAMVSLERGTAEGLNNMSGQFTDWFSWLTQAFSNVGNWIGDLLGNIGSAIGSVFTGGGGSGINLGGIVSSALGIFGGFFAEGGRPPAGEVSVVGEKGPELFVPDSAGTVVPNRMLAGVGGGGGVVNHFHMNYNVGLGEGNVAVMIEEHAELTQEAIMAATALGFRDGSMKPFVRGNV